MPKTKKKRRLGSKRSTKHRKRIRHVKPTKHSRSHHHRKHHRKKSSRKPKKTIGRFVSRISALSNYKKSDLANYLKGAKIGDAGRVKASSLKKLSPLVSQKGVVLKNIGSPGWDGMLLSIIGRERELLLRLKSKLEEGGTVSFSMKDVERKGTYLNAFDKRLREQKKLLAKLGRSLDVLKKESGGEQKFPKESLLIALIDSKIEKERLFLSLVKKYFLGIRREASSLSERMVTRDKTLIDVILSNLEKQESVLRMHSDRSDAVKTGELMKLLEPVLYRKERDLIGLLLARKSTEASSSIKQKIKEKTLINLIRTKVREEGKLIGLLRSQLSRVKGEKIRREITQNIREEVERLMKEAKSPAEEVGEPKISKDELFKKYRIKMPSNLLIDSLLKMAEMEDYTVEPTS